MIIKLLQHWQIVVDGLQIFLCLLILICLIRHHRRKMKPDALSANRQSGPDFNFQVFTEAIDQQVELAFTNILQVAANERRNLDKVMQFQKLNYVEPDSKEGLPPAPVPHGADPPKRVTETASQSDRQARIQQLAIRGLSAKQISDELKTPLGEIELVMSLQK